MIFTEESRLKLEEYLATRSLSKGLGTNEEACSIAAINLAITGELKDEIPACMSPVIGRWIIGIQDAMPDRLRNSAEWKQLLPLAAGTGRELEKEKLSIILDWIWLQVLPTVSPLAKRLGFNTEWEKMLTEKTFAAARAARAAADAAAARAAADADDALLSAARTAADAAVYAAALLAAADAAARAVDDAAAARAAVDAAVYADLLAAADVNTYWNRINPVRLLARLVVVSQ